MDIEPFQYVPEEPMSREDILYWSIATPSDDSHLFEALGSCDPVFSEVDPPLSLPSTSAFVGYVRPTFGTTGEPAEKTKEKNMHKRMLEFMSRHSMTVPAEMGARAQRSNSGENRCFRHMMRERQRRERISQSYADLYALVSPRSKADKNSIVRSTAAYLRELTTKERALRRREGSDVANINLKVANPSSSVEFMIAAIRSLKAMGVRASSIACCSSELELSATISFQTKTASTEVERAVQGVLVEVENKLRAPVNTHLPQQ